jgi:hypothetical protein
MPPSNTCRATWLGTVDYLEARELQLALLEKVHAGAEPNTMLLLEHPHVYTKGRLSKQTDVLLPEEELATKGIPVFETDRGGQVTYHGPGQLVVYPIINLREWGGPVKYVRALEQVVIATLAAMEITANCESGNTGQDQPRHCLSRSGPQRQHRPLPLPEHNPLWHSRPLCNINGCHPRRARGSGTSTLRHGLPIWPRVWVPNGGRGSGEPGQYLSGSMNPKFPDQAPTQLMPLRQYHRCLKSGVLRPRCLQEEGPNLQGNS